MKHWIIMKPYFTDNASFVYNPNTFWVNCVLIQPLNSDRLYWNFAQQKCENCHFGACNCKFGGRAFATTADETKFCRFARKHFWDLWTKETASDSPVQRNIKPKHFNIPSHKTESYFYVILFHFRKRNCRVLGDCLIEQAARIARVVGFKSPQAHIILYRVLKLSSALKTVNSVLNSTYAFFIS